MNRFVVTLTMVVLATVMQVNAQSYDWQTCDDWGATENGELRYENNRWAGDQGCIYVDFGPPTVTWWTEHHGTGGLSASNAAFGNCWGNTTEGSPLPAKISDIEKFILSWDVSLGPQEDGNQFKVYWQFWFGTNPGANDYDAGDFAPTIYQENCDQDWWGTNLGTHEIGGSTWRICDCGENFAGSGRYFSDQLSPYVQPNQDRRIRVENIDMKSLFDWHVGQGHYPSDIYVMAVQFAWEIFNFDGTLKTNDMAAVVKVKGQPEVMIPSWSAMFSTASLRRSTRRMNNKVRSTGAEGKRMIYTLDGARVNTPTSCADGVRIVTFPSSQEAVKILPWNRDREQQRTSVTK